MTGSAVGESHDGAAMHSLVPSRVPTWEALTGRRLRALPTQPLHVKKEVVGALHTDKVLLLPMRDTLREQLHHALRWIRWSPEYEAMESKLHEMKASGQSLRMDKIHMSADDTQLLFDARKLGSIDREPLAYCNGFLRAEEKEDGVRRRPLYEPLINDLISAQQVRTCYTSKAHIRRAVKNSQGGVQYDYAAWFDQIKIDDAIRHLFGVRGDTPTALNVLAMGYRPSCQVAQSLTEAISDTGMTSVEVSSCVDNVLFTGDYHTLQQASKIFLDRCDSVHAIVKDRTENFATRYEFLGEAYDHDKSTRCLTEKTRAKAQFVVDSITNRRVFTTRQILAVYGLLFYASEVLRITLARFHWSLRFLSSVAGNELEERHQIPAHVAHELMTWAKIASDNQPVAVWTERDPQEKADLTIYVDASGEGWGALSIAPSGAILTVGHRWTHNDMSQWNLSSSVAAEPLALRYAVAMLVPAGCTRVTIFTDHQPLTYAHDKGYGKAYAYSRMVDFLEQYPTTFSIKYVPGHLNPADILSRRFTTKAGVFPPPILPVTHIGGRCVPHPATPGERGGRTGGCGDGASRRGTGT